MLWRATVLDVDADGRPVIEVPAVFGPGVAISTVGSLVSGLTPGDRVVVADRLDGRTDAWLVVGRLV